MYPLSYYTQKIPKHTECTVDEWFSKQVSYIQFSRNMRYSKLERFDILASSEITQIEVATSNGSSRIIYCLRRSQVVI